MNGVMQYIDTLPRKLEPDKDLIMLDQNVLGEVFSSNTHQAQKDQPQPVVSRAADCISDLSTVDWCGNFTK